MLIWYALFLTVVCVAGAADTSKEKKGLETLQSLIKRNSAGPFRLTAKNFTKYATERPRFYQVWGITIDSDGASI